MAINEEKFHQLMGQAIVEVGGVLNAGLILMGERLGLYKALAASGPMTPEQLAQKTGTNERYVREWLAAQAAGGFVTFDSITQRYSLSEEQAFTLAQEDSPAYLPGAFQVALAAVKSVPKITEAFRNGNGVGWHEHDPELFEGTERFFRPNYAANLTTSWIPSLDGVEAKLKAGGRAADVGCGHGASTILMAKSYPQSHFFGFDYHGASIEWARKKAAAAGVADRTTFEIAKAKEVPAKSFDFVAFFDCLHDMGDPVGAAAHIRQTLAPGGTCMLVEPFASDRMEENLNPVGRLFYAASTMVCTPCSRSQEVGLALGAQAGEARLRDVFTKAGFQHFRRATQTPFNLVFEARA